MMNQEYEEIIKEYFRSWVEKDLSAIDNYFADDIVYTECYGPVYKGKEQCLQWFNDWNEKGSVLEWGIKRLEFAGDTCFAEWFFSCEFDGKPGAFDGVSIIEFNDGKIISVKEFQSKTDHYHPYGK